MRKQLLCMAIATFGYFMSNAQDGERIFKRFKGDVSFGYAAALGASPGAGSGSGSTTRGGFIFALEPKFTLMDQLSVGLRIEGTIMGDISGNNVYGNTTIENAKGIGSYTATADYYFTTNYSIRPFVGGGAGIFGIIADATITDDNVTERKFGGLLRVGAEVKHFRFGIEYNLIPSSNFSAYDNMGNPTTGKYKNAYVGIKLGFCFGGGPL